MSVYTTNCSSDTETKQYTLRNLTKLCAPGFTVPRDRTRPLHRAGTKKENG